MDPRRTAGAPGSGPVMAPRTGPPPTGPPRRSARDEALERVDRWKRATAVAAVLGFAALLGLVGVAGARGSADAATPPSVTDRPGDGARQVDPDGRPDDGFFGRGGDQDDGYGFGDGGDGGAQAAPFGRSGAS